MTAAARVRCLLQEGGLDLPFPGAGNTARRHWELAQIARENLEVARLAEAHVDAVAILHEAGSQPEPGALYGVWASEGKAELAITNGAVSGLKAFCTGAGLIDRALVTVMKPERCLLEIDLHAIEDHIRFDASEWVTDAFAATSTATATFLQYPVSEANFVGRPGWYLARPGFWHGACGPAACWAGGALGLIDYAVEFTRETNPHALSHLGALTANAWQLEVLLRAAGDEIDGNGTDVTASRARALCLRHLVEQVCTNTMHRFGRALGPRPLAFDAAIARRYQELTLYIRQSHAESDLEDLGRLKVSAQL